MKDILILEPKDRLGTLEALRHPYFKGLNDEFLEQRVVVKQTKLSGRMKDVNGRSRTGSSKMQTSKNFVIRKLLLISLVALTVSSSPGHPGGLKGSH